MDYSKLQKTRTVQSVVVLIGLFVIVGLFIATGSTHEVPMFNLRFNSYALFSIATVVITLIFLFKSTRINIRGSEAIWFNLFICCVTIFAGGEAMMRLSATPEGAIFWDKFLGIGALESAAAFLFVLNYLNPKVRHVRTSVFLILGALIIFFFFSNTNIVVVNTVAATKLYGWGFYNDSGKWYLLYVIWILTISFASFYLIARFIRRNRNPVLGKQAKLFFVAFLLPLIGVIVTEDILPAFGYQVLSFHVIFAAISAGIMLWGLERYHVFRISPAMISEEILSLMSESVVVVNKDLGIEFINQETEQLLKRAGPALMQRPITDFLTEKSHADLTTAIERLRTKPDASIDTVEIINDEKSKTYARISISQVTEEQGIEGHILVITDITELKNSYDALEDEKASVERVVETRTKELRDAQAKLMETDKMKTEFVLLTSHNLRTPLAAIKGNIELLGMDGIDVDQRGMLLADLKSASLKLGDLVEDLLTISTIEAGDSVMREQITLDTVFAKLIAEGEVMAKVGNNTFVSHVAASDVQLIANAHQIQAAVRNILDNACKFTKEGRVTLSVAAHKEKMIITIADTGIGISKDELPKLFTKFHRATSAMQYDYDGEGIGLYLSKLIIGEHGGTIGVVSTEGKGTTFTIMLPTLIAESN